MEDDMEMEMDYLEKSLRRRQRISAAFKAAITFFFSHVGLATLVIGYSIMGGFLFQALEAPNETKEKIRIRSVKEAKIAEIRQLADLFCIRSITPENFTDLVNDIQINFQTQVYMAVKNNGWDGKEETDEATTQWSFAGSLLYAVTVITTIGYGHVAPKTTSGRLVTILYALIGIPLTFLYLSNMGNFMAECFRLFYKKICCGMCIFCINHRQQKQQPQDEEYERMEMAAQSNYAFHDTDDNGKVATVYGEVDAHCRTHISSSNERESALDEGSRRKSRSGDWERHSRSSREEERDRKRVNGPAALNALARGSRFQETQFTTKAVNDGGRGGLTDARERGASQVTRSTDAADARHSTATEYEENSSHKDERNQSQKKLITDSKKAYHVPSYKTDERNKCCRRNDSGGNDFDAKDERHLVSLDLRQRRRMTKRRHSLESAVVMTSPSSMSFDQSVDVSDVQIRCRDPDGLIRTASSSFNPLLEGSRNSEGVGIRGHKMLTPAPSGESGVQLPTGRKYMSSASDISPNSNATETSLSESKDYIPLRRLQSRARASASQQGSRDRGVASADGEKSVTEVEERNDADDDDEEEEEDEEQQRVMFGRMMGRRNRLSRSESVLDDSEVSVPISICLIIIGLYIFSGSLLFTVWEDWDYLTGSYFCFVTLSTIGFGDIVPGTDMKEWEASKKLILCSLWLVVGLSLLAMCFNLMQEEVKDKCKWIGMKLGILKDVE